MAMNLSEKMRAYRLPETTTGEDIGQCHAYAVEFGNKVLFACYHYEPDGKCYFSAVYEHVTEDKTCEGKIKLVAVSDERFEDAGHALLWGMRN